MKNKIIFYIKLLRPKQWIKNFFVFAPLIFSGSFIYFDNILNIIITFFLFILASSITYIINDCIDFEDDKKHPTKKINRPIAAEKIKLFEAIIYALLLLIPLIVFSFVFSKILFLIISLYLCINLLYSLILKKIPFLDILIISSGFILRIYAGAIAISVYLSPWMITITLFIGLYLASLKRYQELNLNTYSRDVFKFYNIYLLKKIALVNGVLTIISYFIFIIVEAKILFFTIPFVVFGIYRYWILVKLFDKGESPTDTVFSDKLLIIICFLWLFFTIISIMSKFEFYNLFF